MNAECITESSRKEFPEEYDIYRNEMKAFAELVDVKIDEGIFYYTSLIYNLGFKRGMRYQKEKEIAKEKRA